MNSKPICLLALLTVMTFSCGPDNKSSVAEVVQPISIKTAPVSTSETSGSLQLSGNIEGNKTIKLGFMVAGKLQTSPNTEGQLVKKGQLIGSLDPSNYAIAKELADVQVRQVQDEYNRLKILFERNSLSESDFKKVNFTLDQARTQQKLHTKNLSDTKLYAPMDGIILKKISEVGEIVGTGIPVVVLSDISKVKVNAYVPESDLGAVKIGHKATVTIAALGKDFDGLVTEVGAAADPTSRAFTIKIELNNPNMIIKPGMVAEIAVQTGQTKSAITLPVETVLKDVNGESYVYVVDPKSNKAFKRKIALGAMDQNKIQVLSGLEVGEQLVVGGQNKLTEGSAVQIIK